MSAEDKNFAGRVAQEFGDVGSAVRRLKGLHWLFFLGAITALVLGFIRQQQAFPESPPLLSRRFLPAFTPASIPLVCCSGPRSNPTHRRMIA